MDIFSWMRFSSIPIHHVIIVVVVGRLCRTRVPNNANNVCWHSVYSRQRENTLRKFFLRMMIPVWADEPMSIYTVGAIVTPDILSSTHANISMILCINRFFLFCPSQFSFPSHLLKFYACAPRWICGVRRTLQLAFSPFSLQIAICACEDGAWAWITMLRLKGKTILRERY